MKRKKYNSYELYTREEMLEIAKKEPNRVKVINSVDSIENIHKQVVQLFVELEEKLAK